MTWTYHLGDQVVQLGAAADAREQRGVPLPHRRPLRSAFLQLMRLCCICMKGMFHWND